MNVDEILEQAGLPEAAPDVETAWATVSQRGRRRRTRKRTVVGTCGLAVIAIVLVTLGWQRTSDDDVNVAADVEDPRSASAGEMAEVTYRGVTFDVPSGLPVSEPSAYEFRCLTYRADGVFLAPDDAPLDGTSCPATFEYGRTIHVQPLTSEDPGDRTVEGEGSDERWVTGTETNRWYEAALPHYGLLFTFYELEMDVREAVLSSVRRA